MALADRRERIGWYAYDWAYSALRGSCRLLETRRHIHRVSNDHELPGSGAIPRSSVRSPMTTGPVFTPRWMANG